MPDPGAMPYIIEKGAIFSVFDSRYSGSVQERSRLLRWLRLDANYPGGTDGNPAGGPQQATLLTRVLDILTGGTTGKMRVDHTNTDWFGLKQDANAPTGWQVPAGSGSTTTGWWKHWRGSSREIMREAMTRALEVSLDIDHGDAPASTVSRCWPIEFLWICGLPRFEAWVTWRKHGPGLHDGHVTVILITPVFNGSCISSQLTFPAYASNPPPNYRVDPMSANGDNGMWVIGHDVTKAETIESSKPTEDGQCPAPHPVMVGEGPIVVVEPAEKDGGVLSGGRSWERVRSAGGN